MLFQRPILDLFLPMRCLLCNSQNGPVCETCEKSLQIRSRQVERHDLHGVAAISYSKAVASLISQYKSESMITLARGFARAMASAVLETNKDWCDQNAVLVPIPEHLKTSRSFSPTTTLAAMLAPRLGISWTPGLCMVKNTEDQASLDLEARKRNLIGSMAAKKWMTGKKVLLVDDIVTTGSTLIEAQRALNEVGCEVRGFVTFAETLKKSAMRT